MAEIQLGDNFSIDEDSNGDYVITYDPTDTVIERIDSGNEEKIFEVGTQISDLKDATSGATVYDSTAEELTADVNNQAVSTGSASVSSLLNLGETGVEPVSATIQDDSVFTHDISQDILLYVTADIGQSSGLFLSDFDTLQTVSLLNSITNQGTTDLTGTTGPDSTLNVSRVDNGLHVENRRGQEVTVDILVFTR